MRYLIAVLLAAVLAAPSVTLAQDVKAEVTAGSQAWQAAWNAGDAAAIAAVYAEDAMVMAPGAEPVKGRAAIQSFWQAALDAAPGTKAEIKTMEVHDLGDMAVEVGTYVDTGPDGEHVDHGNFLAVWKKTGEGWRIARDIFNSNMAQ